MDSECWDRTIEICAAAQELKPEACDAFVREACGDDQELLKEVQQLLQQNAEKNSFLDQSPTEIVAQEIAGELLQYQTGQVINDYTLQKRLGSGGMGEVWLAEDSKPRRNVALKLLPLAFSQNADWVHRFNQEAYAASRCQHENIIEIYKIGQEGEQHFIAMEYFVGKTLRERLQDSKLEPSIAIHLAVQIAAALETAHEKGVIHRDIKPENIIVSAQDKVKVLDFGIAKLTTETLSDEAMKGEEETDAPVTAVGKTMGTAGYMSPEQAKGEPLDHRTDIFSLGLVLLEMVTGTGLFAGKEKKEVLELLQREQEPLPANYNFKGTPKPLAQIIRKAVKHDPAARYDTAQAMLTDLQALQNRAAIRQFKVRENWLKLAIAGILTAFLLAVFFSVQEVWEEKVMREGHTAAVRRAVFSPDGKLVVSVSEDKRVIVWDFASRKQLKVLTDHQGWVTSVNFSPDGKLFATASEDQTVIIWDTEHLEKRTILRCNYPVHFVAFSPDGNLLAASLFPSDRTMEGKTILWNTANWRIVQQLPKGTDYANLLFAPDSRSLATRRYQFDLSTGQAQPKRGDTTTGNWGEFSPDKKMLVIVGGGGDVDFFALREPGKITDSKLLGSFHAHQDFGRSVAFSPDGKLVATASENVVLWDVATRQILGRFEYDSIVWGVTFSPDGRWLISTHGDGAILVWDVAARRRASGFNGHGDAVRAVAISSDGKYIASAGDDRAVIIWNVESGKKEMTLIGHNTRITGLVISPDGKWVASCDQDGYLIRWDLKTREPRWKVRGASVSIGLSIAPNGNWLALSYNVYDAEDGREVLRFDVGGTEQTAFSADSQRLIGVGAILHSWDTAKWQKLNQRKDVDSMSIGVSYAPDGKNFVVGDAQGNIRIWDAKSLRPLEIIGKHNARIKQLTYTPDGKEIISAGDDRKIVVWDVSGRKQLRTIGAYTSPVYSIALSQDGKKLVAGGHDKLVRLYTWHHKLWGIELDKYARYLRQSL